MTRQFYIPTSFLVKQSKHLAKETGTNLMFWPIASETKVSRSSANAKLPNTESSAGHGRKVAAVRF